MTVPLCAGQALLNLARTAQRVRQPLAEAKPKASRLHVMLAALML
jgi:hypothetical protein